MKIDTNRPGSSCDDGDPSKAVMPQKIQPQTLRDQAEAISLEQSPLSPEELAAMSPEAMYQIVHELRVHQIELEMQNEELRQSREALEALHARYFDLYDLAPVGYCTLSESGLILQTNLLASIMLGAARSTLVGKVLSRFLFNEDADRYYLLCRKLLETAEPQTSELRIVRTDGGPLWVLLVATVGRDENGATIVRVVLSDISQRKQAEAALRKSEFFATAILDSLDAEIAVVDHDGIIGAVNQSWRRFSSENAPYLGQPAPTLEVGANYLAQCHAVSGSGGAEARAAYDGIHAVLSGNLPTFSMEYTCHSPEQQRWFGMSVTPFVDGAVIAHTNITKLKQAESTLREQLEFFHLIAENIGDFIAVLDPQGRRLYNSPAYEKFFSTTRDMLDSDSFAEIHPDDRERLKTIFRETVRTGRGQQTHYRFVLPDGSIREMESVGNAIKDSQGLVARVVVVSRDITERKLIEDQVRLLAFHDALTKLPNRRLLIDRLDQAVATSTRRDCFGALMFLDLDRFKPLNDSHGHGAGDLLLVQVADRLKACVREMDTVARFGGDEFVVMINELHTDSNESRAQAALIAEKIRASLAVPYPLALHRDGQADTKVEYQCTASIGVALFSNNRDSDDILKSADTAMYRAKENGNNRVQFADA